MRYLKTVSLITILSIFIACGGGGSGSSNVSADDIDTPTVSTKTAVLYDSIVMGARYDAGSGITGTTDTNGIFRYIEGQNVKFYVGDVFIGEGQPVDKPNGVSVVTDKIITPLGLANVGDDINNSKVLKIVRFLMSLDRDANASNGIDIELSRVADYDLELLDENIELSTSFSDLSLPTLSEARKQLLSIVR